MSDTKILREMLLDEVLTPLGSEHGKPIIELHEEASARPTIIREAPEDSLVIKADEFPAPTDFFEGSKGENKRADFIVISEAEEVILYIELKSGKAKGKEIKQQLKGAVCVLSYCKEVANQFWNEGNFLDDKKYVHRYIALVETDADKRPTFHDSELHDSAESLLKISSPHRLTFSKLAAN